MSLDLEDVEFEVTKVHPHPGDTVVVTLKSDGIDDAICSKVRTYLEKILPVGVKVAVFGCGPMDFVSIEECPGCKRRSVYDRGMKELKGGAK